jgi:hypothetical protein
MRSCLHAFMLSKRPEGILNFTMSISWTKQFLLNNQLHVRRAGNTTRGVPYNWQAQVQVHILRLAHVTCVYNIPKVRHPRFPCVPL